MTPLRLLLVTPRYWPQAGDLEFTASHLAEGLTELDVQVSVLTGNWGPDWPRSFMFRGIPVIRVPHAPRGGWNTFRYLTAMSRWLRKHQHEIDLVYVLNLRYEAYAAIGALRGTGIPTLLRCQDYRCGGDGWWQTQARFGSRIKRYCQQAAGIITPNPFVAEELVGFGYERSQLHDIPLGVVSGEARSADRRFRARAALADANHDLAAAEYAPVALFAGRLDDFDGLSNLIAEWREVATRWPSARLWLIGEGPARDSLGEKLVDLNLRYQTVLPGAFEDWSDLFHAADVLIWPTTYGGRQLLLEAMAAGLPVVAADSPDLRAMMEHERHGLLVPTDSPGAWTAAISHLFDAPRLAAQMGAAASKLVTARFPRRQMAEAHWELFERLLPRRRS